MSDLRDLLSRATPLPWCADPFQPGYPSDGVPIIGLRLNDAGTPLETPTNGIVAAACLLPTEIDALDETRAAANAALIVAAVNALPNLLSELDGARERIAELEADSRRLDFLDECNRRLNAKYGTSYGWHLILNHNVNRLMLGHLEVDLCDNDGRKGRLTSCRTAIDAKMDDIARARALGEKKS